MIRLFVLASVLSLGLCQPGSYHVVTDAGDLSLYGGILNDLQTQNLYDSSCRTTQISVQVVAGLNIKYELTCGHSHTCEIVVFFQAWTNTRSVSSNTCSHKRQLLAGGYYTQTDAAEIQKYIDKLALYLTINEPYNVTKVETQVVAGINIKYTIKIGDGTCEVVLFEQAWTNTHQVTHNTCTQHPVKRQFGGLLGGWQDVSSDNDGIQMCLSKSLDSVNLMSNSLFRLVDSRIISAKQQVVAGMNYAVTFETLPSTCLNNQQYTGKTSSYCAVDTNTVAQPNTWKGQCYQPLSGDMQLSGVNMQENEASAQSTTDVGLDTAVNSVMSGVMKVKQSKSQELPVKINQGNSKFLGRVSKDLSPNVSILRKKRNADYLLDILNQQVDQHGQQWLEQGKKLLGGGLDHDVVNHVKDLLGQDTHDFIKHSQDILGGDGHDYVNHVQKLLGGDDHDYVDHGKKLLGGDDHDLKVHGTNSKPNLIGGDDHDYVAHGKKLLGGDDHDLKYHGASNKTVLIGGDDHDYCHKGMFLEFKQRFGKLYGSNTEEEKRYVTFCDNMRIARKLQESEKGTARYGPTKFADLTREEFKQYVGKKWDTTANQWMKKAEIPKGSIPDSFDWRDHGAVTPVKNQGQCGSCWAFSTTGNIEGQWAIKKKQLISLSEQELVDCDKLDEGCNGGLPSNAYKEIERLGGLETEADYAYKGEDEKCQFVKSEVKVYINDSLSISSNETEMASWLVANGPISIGINAFAMQFYMGGISHPWKIFCNPANLDHGVLIVGYGVDGSEPYWIVKNSWGPDWGEKGYYLVYRGGGVCGLNTMCTSAVVD